MRAHRIAIAAVLFAAVPAFLLRSGLGAAPITVSTALFGLAIVAAAFALSWAAEAAERDVPRALALTAVALLAVLPEYSVDIVFAWKAGQDPAFAPYAAANMTGSNRLLLGIGWPAVVGFAWLRHRKTVVPLDRGSIPGLAFLAGATVYSFILPLKGTISLVDSAVLFALFLAYAALAATAEKAEPDLVGPAATIGALPALPRRLAIAGLLGFAFLTIAASAAPFAEGLIHSGRALHVDEFLLVQWLAPFASEAPEFLVAALLASRGKGTAALALLVSAKLNQWTLLVGSLPVAYSFGAGHAGALALDQRQTAEVLLTAAQSLFGLGVIATLSLSLGRGALLAGLFLSQIALGGLLRVGLHAPDAASTELLGFTVLYLLLAPLFFFRARGKTLRAPRISPCVVGGGGGDP